MKNKNPYPGCILNHIMAKETGCFKYLVVWLLLTIFIMLAVSLFSQTINLEFGSNFIPDKTLFDKPYTNSPRPFVYAGVSYIHDTGVRVGVTFTPNVKIVTLQTSVPLFALRSKRSNFNFALANNSKRK